jgi:hypothetical protein
MVPSPGTEDTSTAVALAPHRSLSWRRGMLEPWVRRGLLAVLALFVAAALLDFFGQRPVASRARAAGAELSVQSPENLRGGLIFQSRFTVTARRDLRKPTLVLANGWFESMSVNSIVPQPTDQVSGNGEVRLTYPRIRAGDSLRVWIYFQANPTNVGSRSQDVELYDGTRRLARIRRDVTVWP